MKLKPSHFAIIDAIGSGKHRFAEIEQATGRVEGYLRWRLLELARLGVISAQRTQRPGVRGRPPKEYKLNPWTAKPISTT